MFTYPNPNKGLTKVWTTLPLDGQNVIASHPYDKKFIDDGQNEMYLITLQENEEFTLKYPVDLDKQHKQEKISK